MAEEGDWIERGMLTLALGTTLAIAGSALGCVLSAFTPVPWQAGIMLGPLAGGVAAGLAARSALLAGGCLLVPAVVAGLLLAIGVALAYMSAGPAPWFEAWLFLIYGAALVGTAVVVGGAAQWRAAVRRARER